MRLKWYFIRRSHKNKTVDLVKILEKNSDDFGGNRPSLQKTKDQRIIKNNHSETANIYWEIRCGCIWKGESSSGMR